ncbi:hypothetical protein [Xenorhabdus sp. PB30.3]|uniref:hypothetical protein n=1 Tax=Xenorhabdus sp. PB30.3 TaxID=2788941 RepID=UPI001E31378C|nr:hypothetical protein [Xenorhabdus sp. PB30.3]MCC8380094.1 hypothetical protein [Xenorhabdus sp. PB30.3]
MTIEKNTVAAVLQSALNPARYQLGIAANKTEGIAHTSVNAAITIVDQLEALVIEQYNIEIDEFNELCDALETSQLQLANTEKDLNAFRTNFTELELQAQKSISEAEREKAKAKISQANVKDKMEELKRLQNMKPEDMRQRIADQRKKLDEKQKLLEQQRIAISELKKQVVDAETKKSVMIQTNIQLAEEAKEMRSHLMHQDGDIIKKEFSGTDNNLKCYIHVFEYGLSFRPGSADIKIINDLNWHFEVKSNYGLSLTISVTEWLQPFYPPCDYLADRWPTDIHDALHDLIVDRVELTHPHLIERMEWAKENYLEEADLDPKHVEILNNAGFQSLYSVLHVPPHRLLTIIKDNNKEAAKSFGEAAVKQLYAKLEKTVKQWQQQNENWNGTNRKITLEAT